MLKSIIYNIQKCTFTIYDALFTYYFLSHMQTVQTSFLSCIMLGCAQEQAQSATYNLSSKVTY